MLQVAIISRYPLYRQSIAQILKLSDATVVVHEGDTGAGIETIIRSAELLIVLDDVAKSIGSLLSESRGRRQIRILFSEVFGAYHRHLLRSGTFHCVMPMRASVEAVDELLLTLVRILGDASVAAGINYCRRVDVERRFYPDLNDLTCNEKRVLSAICKGLPNDAISRELGVTLSSVKASIARIRRKLGLNSRHQAAALYMRFQST